MIHTGIALVHYEFVCIIAVLGQLYFCVSCTAFSHVLATVGLVFKTESYGQPKDAHLSALCAL